MAHLKKMGECIIPVRFGETRSDYADMIMIRFISACLNLLSISMAQFPHELQNENCVKERGLYLDLMESFATYYYGARNLSNN